MENFQNRLNLFWLRCRGGFTAASSPAPKENAELQEMAKLSAHKGLGKRGARRMGTGQIVVAQVQFSCRCGCPNIKRITHAAATSGPITWQIVCQQDEPVFQAPQLYG